MTRVIASSEARLDLPGTTGSRGAPLPVVSSMAGYRKFRGDLERQELADLGLIADGLSVVERGTERA
jgi:hypothetical protein